VLANTIYSIWFSLSRTIPERIEQIIRDVHMLWRN